jgi:hypothetical protein
VGKDGGAALEVMDRDGGASGMKTMEARRQGWRQPVEELIGRSRHEEDEGGHALTLTCDESRVRAAQLDFDMSVSHFKGYKNRSMGGDCYHYGNGYISDIPSLAKYSFTKIELEIFFLKNIVQTQIFIYV